MSPQTAEELTRKKCLPCEGGVQPLTRDEAQAQLGELPGWQLVRDGQRIRKEWVVKNFMAGMKFFNQCAELAETEGHHPDLHLKGYRNVALEGSTHANRYLVENDYIVPVKIDLLPVELRTYL